MGKQSSGKTARVGQIFLREKNLNNRIIIWDNESENKILSCDIHGNYYFYRKHLLACNWKQLSIYAMAYFILKEKISWQNFAAAIVIVGSVAYALI